VWGLASLTGWELHCAGLSLSSYPLTQAST